MSEPEPRSALGEVASIGGGEARLNLNTGRGTVMASLCVITVPVLSFCLRLQEPFIASIARGNQWVGRRLCSTFWRFRVMPAQTETTRTTP